MPAVDYWRGTCLYCLKRFDCDEDGHLWGDIQTKIFSFPYSGDFPGEEVPEYQVTAHIVARQSTQSFALKET